MTRQQFYSELYDTRGLKSTRSTHILTIWIEFNVLGARDYTQTLAFASKADAEEYLARQLERWFGTTDVYTYAEHDGIEGHYEIPCNGYDGANTDFFPEEIARSIKKICYRFSNTPICKY